MKKLLLKILIITFSLILCLSVISACDGTRETSTHTHDYTTLKFDEIKHWYECSCGERDNIRIHRGGEATCIDYPKCEVCNEVYGDLSECSFKDKECIHCGKKSPSEGLHYYWGAVVDGETGAVVGGVGSCADTEIIIPKQHGGYNVLLIASYAFKNCNSITYVVISDTVKSIDEKAFNNCNSLKKVFIPNSVTKIGKNVFEGCGLLTIYCEAESQPSGWESDWNPNNCPVVWGYIGD